MPTYTWEEYEIKAPDGSVLWSGLAEHEVDAFGMFFSTNAHLAAIYVANKQPLVCEKI